MDLELSLLGMGYNIQLPATFRDPASFVGFPGPGPATFFVAGGSGIVLIAYPT